MKDGTEFGLSQDARQPVRGCYTSRTERGKGLFVVDWRFSAGGYGLAISVNQEDCFRTAGRKKRCKYKEKLFILFLTQYKVGDFHPLTSICIRRNILL